MTKLGISHEKLGVTNECVSNEKLGVADECVSNEKSPWRFFYCKLVERPGVASGKKEIILKKKIVKNFDFLAYNTPGHLKTILDQYETYMWMSVLLYR